MIKKCLIQQEIAKNRRERAVAMPDFSAVAHFFEI